MGLKFDDRCPYMQRDLKTQRRYRKEGCVRTEAKTGVVLSQAKEHQGQPATTRARKGEEGLLTSRAFSRSMALQTP